MKGSCSFNSVHQLEALALFALFIFPIQHFGAAGILEALPKAGILEALPASVVRGTFKYASKLSSLGKDVPQESTKQYASGILLFMSKYFVMAADTQLPNSQQVFKIKG